VADLYRWMEGKGASPDRQRKAGSRLRQALKECVRVGHLQVNPAARVHLPRAKPEEARALRPDEVNRLLQAAEGWSYEAMLWLALDSGARQGELWALTWADITLTQAGGEVVINKSLQELSGQLRVKPPKTAKGRRRVPILGGTSRRLMVARPEGAPLDGLVFADSQGSFLRKSNFHRTHWQPLLRAAGLEGLKFHSLRHTCATILLTANVHPKVVQERLGHATIEITLNTYSHLLPTMQNSAVEALGTALDPNAVKPQ